MKKPQNISEGVLGTRHAGWSMHDQFNWCGGWALTLQRMGMCADVGVRSHEYEILS